RFLGCGLILPATVRAGVASCELGSVALPWAPDGPSLLDLRPTALRPARTGQTGEVVQRVHRRDHVRLRVRLKSGRVVDAVAGVLDANEPTVTLALDRDGVALISRPG
ncbi:MAG TPA: ABC transporter ATP-binding protein, partial [Actinophytocola sp.]|nr:ABC transporter ATP-binding protein [Actinophytocola sp.]